MKKMKLAFITFLTLLSFSKIVHAECNVGGPGSMERDCQILNNSDGPADPSGRYPRGSLREMIRTACALPGNDDLNWGASSSSARTITLSRAAGSLIIPSTCDGSVTIQGPTGDRAIPVIIDASAFNTPLESGAYPTCAIVLGKNGGGLRNVEIRGGINSICIQADDNSVSLNTIVNYGNSAILVNGSNNQMVGNYVGVYSYDLADSSHGSPQIGIIGSGSNNRIEANTIKFNHNAGIGWLTGIGNRFLQNIIAQNGVGVSLVSGVHNGIQAPIVNSACAERDTATCGIWNVSVTGVPGASVDIYKADSCWPDETDPSCTANAGRGQGEGIKLLARNISLSAGDPPAPGCAMVAGGRVRCTVSIADPEITGTDKISAIQTTSDGSSEFGINVSLNNSVLVIPDVGFSFDCLLRGTCGAPPDAPVCGDGIVNQDSEECDGEMGCDSSCHPATDWTCTRNPADSSGHVHSTCVRTTGTCGDGLVNQDSEVCDGEVGCSSSCQPLSGYVCRRNSAVENPTHSTCTIEVTGSCGNGTCDASETATSCAIDCTPHAGCNFDSTCDVGETVTSCAHDCAGGVTPHCNRDGICDSGETNATCASDCVVVPGCDHDGICDSGETVATCASDCTGISATCNRNGTCEVGETNTSCPLDCPITSDCNHNGTCDAGETSATCASDCSGPSGFNPPRGLTATALPGQVTLHFNDDSTTEEGYRITRATGACVSATGFTTVGTISSANPTLIGPVQYVDVAGVTNSTTYCYRVTGFQGTNSTAFAQVEVTVPGGVPDPGGSRPPGEEMDVQGSGCSLNTAAGSPAGFSSIAFSLLALIRRRFKK